LGGDPVASGDLEVKVTGRERKGQLAAEVGAGQRSEIPGKCEAPGEVAEKRAQIES
jgi:hypothetical protein